LTFYVKSQSCEGVTSKVKELDHLLALLGGLGIVAHVLMMLSHQSSGKNQSLTVAAADVLEELSLEIHEPVEYHKAIHLGLSR
jgi:hypothetical protein